jgi:hypothetical protein
MSERTVERQMRRAQERVRRAERAAAPVSEAMAA